MPLCTQADIEALRQIDVTNEPDPTITALIRHAEGIIEGLTGRQFVPVVDLEVLVSDVGEVDGVVRLPHYPITDLAMEGFDGNPLVENEQYAWDSFGLVHHLGSGTGITTWDWQYNVGPFGSPWLPGTLITYTGGAENPDEVPQDLRTLCAQIAASLYDTGAAGSPGIQSESLGGWSVSYSPGADELSKTQMAVIRRYMHKTPIVAY